MLSRNRHSYIDRISKQNMCNLYDRTVIQIATCSSSPRCYIIIVSPPHRKYVYVTNITTLTIVIDEYPLVIEKIKQINLDKYKPEDKQDKRINKEALPLPLRRYQL
jgi:hypothetical protein